jgi:hypothetical protein
LSYIPINQIRGIFGSSHFRSCLWAKQEGNHPQSKPNHRGSRINLFIVFVKVSAI